MAQLPPVNPTSLLLGESTLFHGMIGTAVVADL